MTDEGAALLKGYGRLQEEHAKVTLCSIEYCPNRIQFERVVHFSVFFKKNCSL